jgi:spore coat protein CotH
VYPDAGVHFRGNTSYSWVATGRKRSLDLSMNMVHSDQRLYGYRSLNFLNANQDPSFMRSVMYHALTMQYTAAPKTNFVRVVINGESWGIYANQEQFNSDMTKEFFGDNKGARWKTPGRPGSRTGLRYMGDNVETYKALYEIKTKDKAESWNDLIHLCKVLNQTPPEQLEAALNNILDIDGALKFLAMDKAMINNDGYWVRASDYSLYEDSTGKFHVFGNDANETLQNPEYMGGWGSEKADLDPFAGAEDPEKALLYRLLKVPSLRERYLRHLKEIANTQLDWVKMAPIFQQAHDLIAADVHADTRKLYTNQDFDKSLTTDLTDYGNGIQDPTSMSIKTFMDQRRQYLLSYPEIKNPK